MNKNCKYLLTCILALAVTVLTANAGYCDDARQQLNAAIFKFFMAMGGVVISSFLLFFILTMYNKMFKNGNNKNIYMGDDSLDTPKNVDDAAALFVKKNKLQ